MYVDHAAFALWLAANRTPGLDGRGYEHAMFMAWLSAGAPGAQPDPSTLPVVAFTDGSGTMSHLPCGAGVVIYEGDEVVLECSRALGLGTNNCAELSAVGIALAVTSGPDHCARALTIRTDSMYVIGALTAPADTSEGKPNARLINFIRRSMAGRTVTFEHVRGHSGVAGNERADELAGMARRRQVISVTRAA